MSETPPRLRDDRRAVSPVVGAVLTLAITVGAVAVVMAWGVPQLQAAQARATVDAVIGELRLLDDLTDAISESGGGVSGEAVVTFDRGGMRVAERGDPWVVTYGTDGRTNLSVDGAADGDARYRLTNRAPSNLSSVHVTHVRIGDDGSTTLGTETIGDLTAGETATVTIRDGTASPVPLGGTAVRVRVHEHGVVPATLVAEAWIVDPGRVRYDLSSPTGHHAVALSNGGLVVETPTSSRVDDAAAVRFGRRGGGPPTLFLSMERLTPDGPTTVGPGSWELKAVAGTTRSLIPSGVEATNLTVSVPDRGADWGQAIWTEHARSAGDGLRSPVVRTGDGVRFDGPVELHLFYRRIVFPTGFEPT